MYSMDDMPHGNDAQSGSALPPLISTNERRIHAQAARPYPWFLAAYIWLYQQYHEWTDDYCAMFFYLSLDDFYRLCLYTPPDSEADIDRTLTLLGHTRETNGPLTQFLLRVLDTTRRDPAN